MQKTLAEIAKIVAGEVVGDPKTVITGLNGIKEARNGDLTFVANPKYASSLESTQASAVIISRNIATPDKPCIVVDNPSVAFTKIMSSFIAENLPVLKGIHPSAVIAKDAVLGKNVAVGPCVVIESGAKIGENSALHAGSYIGAKTVIGPEAVIYPNVTITYNSVIGSRVVVHSGTVIGSDGFGYEQIDGVHQKIPQIGNVIIEDDVEIGSNVSIDRARFDKTVIGQGTKIDNLVQIAHNVIIGKNCIIVAQVGISGSTVIEDNCILAGQVGIVGHITIGEGSVIAAQSGVPNSLPPKSAVWGYPARPMNEAKRVNAAVQRLPQYVKKIQNLTRRIETLEKKLREKK